MTSTSERATPTAPIDRNDFRALKIVFIAVLASVVLTACSGGAPTTDLAVPGGGGSTNDAVYTGPAPLDDDVLKFQQEFWSKAKTTDRCGSCHNESVGQPPMFARNDNVNEAYNAAVTVVDTGQPSDSIIVAKVSEGQFGHNCWNGNKDVCATIMTTWIEKWVGSVADGGREIVLTPPISQDPGDSLNFPSDPYVISPDSFSETVYPLLTTYCANCHSSEAVTTQQPYFADPDIIVAYGAAIPKINLDTPANSRFVFRLRVQHECWDDCAANAQEMEDAIIQFSGGIVPTQIDQTFLTSEALRLVDGIPASGGNRYEDAQIALWEFKTGSGSVAYDSSGVDPAIDLNLSPEVSWYGGWGITTNGGRAQGTTTASRKLFDVLQDSGEFSIEAWVIPANVSQEMARIISYSANDQNRNFTLQQNLYDYDFLLLTNAVDQNNQPLTNVNGEPALSTPAMDEVLQATLQHVVATYSPIDGRHIYVNGVMVTNADPIPGGTFADWQETFALVLGSEIGGSGSFPGTFRLAAMHRRALTQAQIQQNYDAGVGEKFFLLFDISAAIQAAVDSSFILFEASQFDSFAYLFDKPHFITLDGSTPTGIPIEGVRVAMNGLEAPVGQTYATMIDTLRSCASCELGQPLSDLGAVLPLGKGPEDDEFFLTFDVLLSPSAYNRQPDPTLVITETDVPVDERSSKIGLKTFDEIDATYAAVTGVNRVAFPLVDMTFLELRQSLPAVEDINTFLSAHQVAIAQLAISYCDAMIGDDGIDPNPPPNPDAATKFPGFLFGAAPNVAFAIGLERDKFVNPLIDDIMGTGLLSQPALADVYAELASFQAAGDRPDNLVDRLLAGGSDTRAISKGVCAAMLASATTLIQ